MRSLLFATLTLLSACAHATDAKAQLVTFLDDLQGLAAEFSQRVMDERGNLLETSRGTLKVKRPGQFRWTYTEPYPQEIIGNKTRVWIYDSELEQVSVKAMDETLGSSPALLLSSDKPLEEAFKVESLGSHNMMEWVELKPLNEESSFASFRMGLADGTLRVMELHDNLGQRTQLSFGNIERNPTLADSVFEFEPPPGADVVGDLPATEKTN